VSDSCSSVDGLPPVEFSADTSHTRSCSINLAMMRDMVPSDKPLLRASSARDIASERRRNRSTAALLCPRT
jgi:hypothetical protein